MPAGGAAAAALPWIIGGVSAAGTVASVIQADKAADKAEEQSAQQLARQDALAKEAEQRAANEESEATAIDVRNKAKQRQRARAVGAGGRQDTILTGPLGVEEPVQGTKKTLLGL